MTQTTMIGMTIVGLTIPPAEVVVEDEARLAVPLSQGEEAQTMSSTRTKRTKMMMRTMTSDRSATAPCFTWKLPLRVQRD